MDIAKYIGLFLLKNSFCYLHGLGNLELKKKPASYDGENLRAPEYDVLLTPGGSIDDTLANFIATHEQVSISKAANALREFSMATRAELAAGKEVEIPGLGKFIDVNGVTRFVANPHFQHTPPPVPIIRMAKRLEDKPSFSSREPVEPDSDNSTASVAWGKVALLGLIALVIIIGGFLAYRYFSGQQASSTTDTVATQQPPIATVTPVDTTPASFDTAQPAASVPAPAVTSGGYTVVLNQYSSRAAADRRIATLTNNGNQVEVLMRDSSNYLVVIRMPATVSDTTRMLDSLRRFFNPKGVHILH